MPVGLNRYGPGFTEIIRFLFLAGTEQKALPARQISQAHVRGVPHGPMPPGDSGFSEVMDIRPVRWGS